MANSPQEEFVHPVIQAMQNAFQQIQGAKQQKFQQALDTREADLRQQQFDELKSQHALEEKHANEQHDINTSLLDIQRRQHALDLTKNVNEFISSGGKGIPDMIPGLLSSVTGQGGVQTPDIPTGRMRIPNSDVTFDPQGYSTPEDQFNRQYQQQTQLAGGVAGATEKAQEPFKVAASARDQANRLSEIGLQGQNAAKVAETNHANDIDLEKLKGGFQLAAARIAHAKGQEDMAPTFQNAFNGVMTGQTNYSALPKDIKEGVSALAGTKGWQLPTNQKDFSTKVDAATGVQTLIDEYRDAALKFSTNSPGNGILNRVNAYTGGVRGSDLRSKIDTLKSQAGTLASFYDKQNRKSDADILRNFVGAFDPTASMEQNLQKLQDHQPLLNQAVRNIFAGFKPEQINYILNTRGLNDLGGLKSDEIATKPPGSGKGKKTMIELDDGTRIADTPENRQLHQIPQE